MAALEDPLPSLRALNETAAFNRWCGFEVTAAVAGRVEITMPWREEAGHDAGYLHAGVIGALIDTACGYAAATVLGTQLLASHYAVNWLRPAVGNKFIARARVVKPGRLQAFTACELFAVSDGKETLVATGETLLCVVS
jgi:uncharacterized protein (TIGR00369 family)